jgi:hypothetical protein
MKCDPTFYQWDITSCRAKTGSEASAPDAQARKRGRVLAERVKLGDWLLVEPYEDEERVWLAKAVQFPSLCEPG